MKTLPLDYCSFTVSVTKPNGNFWKCDIPEIPTPNDFAKTIEQSEKSETYYGETDEYHVKVFCSTTEINVAVYDKSGREILDFNITNVSRATE